MRVTEALIGQNKRNNNQKLRRQNEEEEPTLSYRKREQESWAINQNQSAFDSGMLEGINTRQSVFDKKAVFKT